LVAADIATREAELARSIQLVQESRIKQLIEKHGYTKDFQEKDTIQMNGTFYYKDTLGELWHPIRVQRLPVADDPYGEFLMIYIEDSKLKVPGQIVFFIDGKAVGTSFRGDTENPELNEAGWSNLRVTVPRKMLVDEDAGEEKAIGQILSRLTARVYLLNAGHWDLTLSRLGKSGWRGEDVVAGAFRLDFESVVDAGGRTQQENAEFVAHVAAAAALKAEVETAMAAAQEKAAGENEELQALREEEERKRKAAEARKKEVQRIISDINTRTQVWHDANRLPDPLLQGNTRSVTVDEVRGNPDFPALVNGMRIFRVSPWREENNKVRFRDLDKRNFQYVGMKYRYLQVKTGPDEEPQFLLQAALFFDNRNPNRAVTVGPKVTFHVKELMDEDGAAVVDEQADTIVLRYKFTVQPSWSGYLVATTPISIFQLYRRIGDIEFDPEPKEDARPDIPDDDEAADGGDDADETDEDAG
jgi:hypothetical protein